MTRLAKTTLVTGLFTGLVIGLLAGPARADEYDGVKDYAMRGTVELGGLAGFSRSSYSDVDASLTIVSIHPFGGYFVAPSFAVLGSLDVTYAKPDPGDSETTVAVLGGAGYYLPLGSVYLGPQAQIGYGRVESSTGDSDGAFVAEAQLALKIQIGTGGLATIGAAYRFNRVFADSAYNLSTIALQVGFSVWF